MNFRIIMNKYPARHPYHLVRPSPWPSLGALAALIFTYSLVLVISDYVIGFYFLPLGFLAILAVMYGWWNDVTDEAIAGYHTQSVVRSLQFGVMFFILSEIMFFFGFFWSYFALTTGTPVELGSMWPPIYINKINIFGIPLLNTLILLSSGVTVTIAHGYLICGKKIKTILWLVVTIILALTFTSLQVFEYVAANYTFQDSIFGSLFYILTGFHGLHVLIGTIFLLIGLIRIFYNHYHTDQHHGLEFAIWYWHFVDVVWLFLYLILYVWS